MTNIAFLTTRSTHQAYLHPRAVLAASTPEAVKASSSGCAKQASRRLRHAVSPPLGRSQWVYAPCLSWKTCGTPGSKKTTLDDKDVRVAKSLQGGHRQRSVLTTATIDYQRYVWAGAARSMCEANRPLAHHCAPGMCAVSNSALTRIEQAEVFASIRRAFRCSGVINVTSGVGVLPIATAYSLSKRCVVSVSVPRNPGSVSARQWGSCCLQCAGQHADKIWRNRVSMCVCSMVICAQGGRSKCDTFCPVSWWHHSCLQGRPARSGASSSQASAHLVPKLYQPPTRSGPLAGEESPAIYNAQRTLPVTPHVIVATVNLTV